MPTSRAVPGSDAGRNLDATVFWNYVDLRLKSSAPWRIEAGLGASELVVRIRSPRHGKPIAPAPPPPVLRSAPSGDCLSCGMLECFRHPAAGAAHAPSLGHSAFLLDALWPEFDRWCRDHSREGDRWFTPMDGCRWKKPNYSWSAPPGAALRHATFTTLLRSFRQRHLPSQGALRQQSLLAGDAALADRYAGMLEPDCRHLVVSQNLLPHLWKSGALGGRSFDVLLNRWPMAELQRLLDQAETAHPQSTTLGDFRAPGELVQAEAEALAAAARIITPHRSLARHFGERAWPVDWEMPGAVPRTRTKRPVIFFPASPLGRKGAFELAAAIKAGIDADLVILGRASEGSADPLAGLPFRHGTAGELSSATVVVLPAWIEHQPRIALRALASGIPVAATAACGLPDHPLLHVLETPDPLALRAVLRAILQPVLAPCTAC